jgi:hypothetical protein
MRGKTEAVIHARREALIRCEGHVGDDVVEPGELIAPYVSPLNSCGRSGDLQGVGIKIEVSKVTSNKFASSAMVAVLGDSSNPAAVMVSPSKDACAPVVAPNAAAKPIASSIS